MGGVGNADLAVLIVKCVHYIPEPLAKRQFCKFAGGDRLRPTEAGSGVKHCQPTSCENQPETADGREQT
jgi:hypothetical protein